MDERERIDRDDDYLSFWRTNEQASSYVELASWVIRQCLINRPTIHPWDRWAMWESQVDPDKD